MAFITSIENGKVPSGNTIEEQLRNHIGNDLILTIVNDEDQCALTLDKAPNGKYRIVVVCLEAWLNFSVRFYTSEEKALEKTCEF